VLEETGAMSRTRFAWLALCVVLASACDGGTPRAPTTPEPPPASPPPPPPATMGPVTPTPVPKPSSDPLAGLYTLALSVGPECAAVPEVARTRTYSAAIEPDGPGGYLVTLGDAVFLNGPVCTASAGLGCNQFRATRGTSGALDIDLTAEGEWHGGGIVEQIPPGTWIEINAAGEGPVDGLTIRATLTGSVWYCASERSYPFPCVATSCRTDRMHLTLTRR
jgi:hypothetical protein